MNDTMKNTTGHAASICAAEMIVARRDAPAGIGVPAASSLVLVGSLLLAGCTATTVTKGLEIDAAIVIEPDSIVEYEPQGLRSLYVALTRATRRLTIIDTGDTAVILR